MIESTATDGYASGAREPSLVALGKYVWLKWADAFIGRAGELIREVWPLLKSCAYDPCSRLFVSDGKRIYCTDRCAERDRQARFRPKRSRDHAAEYQRRTANRLGLRDNAKIRIGRKGSRSR
jgi:CGNR zinc finger